MQRLKRNGHYIAATLGVGGFLAAGLMGTGTPLFGSADSFVLLAKDQITIGSNLSHSSGDIGVNNARGKITVGAKSSLNGDLYADTVILGANSTVNGSVTARKLVEVPNTEILGATSTAFSSPLVSPFPSVPNFTTGVQNINIRSNTEQTIQPGSYRNITAGSRNTLTFLGGVYNIDRLTIGSDTTLIFQSPTTLNVKSSATFGSKTIFSPASALDIEDVEINFLGRSLTFGSQGFISGIITAPGANVTLGSNSTIRGQIFGERVVVGSGVMLDHGVPQSNGDFEIESDLSKIVEDEGVQFIVNEIVALFSESATITEVESFVASINGTITGFASDPPTYKIRVLTETPSQLYSVIEQLKTASGPLLIEAVPNLISQ